jgi:hypothetical protein
MVQPATVSAVTGALLCFIATNPAGSLSTRSRVGGIQFGWDA